MTQGAPKNTRTVTKKTGTQAVTDDDVVGSSADGSELDLDAWLAKRGLLSERRVKVAGKSFRFTTSATGEQIVAYNSALREGTLGEALGILLVDPFEKDELVEAFKNQRQPLSGALEQEFFQQMLKYVTTGSVDGDPGESSAS